MKNKKLLLYAIIVMIVAVFQPQLYMAYNYKYINVTTQVNVTDAYPEILSITLDQSIIPNAGTTKTIYCNLSIRDYNGYTDINLTNATFWDNASTTMGAADNNTNHYTNTSCAETSNDGQYLSNYSCTFEVWYYANPGTETWLCNATVMDNSSFTDTAFENTTIQTYYALNLTPMIDYGDLTLGTISPNITANISNIGNTQINISVRGYGASPGDGLAMVCFTGNITIDNERFSTNASANWADKTNLASALQNVTNLTIPKRVTTPTWNLTYWQLYIDPTNVPFGICNGTVEFNAVAG